MVLFDRDFFDELFPDDVKVSTEEVCNHNYQITDGHYVCTTCAQVDIHRIQFYELTENLPYKAYFIYHRKSYFREKLRLLVGIKQSLSSEYPKVIEDLRKQKFDSIKDLKQVMKKSGYNHYYKYVYNIFYEIKNIKLITLSLADIDYLTSLFLRLEHNFKTRYPEKSNLMSYNVIIYSLLKKLNYQCHQYIILPKNQRKLLNCISELLK